MPGPLEILINRMELRFPWYGRLREEQAETGKADSSAIRKSLPLITASVLEQHYYTALNPMAVENEWHRYRTSGTSSGLRKTIYYSPQDEAAYLRIKLEVFRSILHPHRYKTALADMGTGHAEATSAAIFRELGMEVHTLSYQLPIEQHLHQLELVKPEVLYTMPSILDRILQASGNPAAYGIRHVILVGEMASPGWIRQAAGRLAISPQQVTDTVGSIEIGTIAYYSHSHERYLLAEGIVAEGVGADELGLEPLPEENEQVLVLTSEVREAFPALRYVTYDVVRDLRPILVDGKPRMSFKSIVKRIGPDLKHGEKISIYDIEQVVYRELLDARIRVEVAGNALVVHVYSSSAEPEGLKRLEQELEQRIPEIGTMVQAGILGGIRVVAGTYDDALNGRSVKNKKIFYT